MTEPDLDVCVVGGGQAALAVGYYLRRSGLRFRMLDEQSGPGGAWRHGWESLRLFSPAQWSSLPGRLMEGGPDTYPSRDDVLAYLEEYETRYALPVVRPARVDAVRREEGRDGRAPSARAPDDPPRRHPGPRGLLVEGRKLHPRPERFRLRARAVVSATGTWGRPWSPDVPGRDRYRGIQLHSAHYRAPDRFRGLRVLVVGGGNSGAQILAELSRVAETTWVTLEPPRFLPDDVDGRVLFERATRAWRARDNGKVDRGSLPGLGDIVMVPPVREARDRGALRSVRPFVRFTEEGVVWSDGRRQRVDAVLWCTGFRPALEHLKPLGLEDADGRIATDGTRAVAEPRLWLVGYGGWTGFASATLIGGGRSARATVEEIVETLRQARERPRRAGGTDPAGGDRRAVPPGTGAWEPPVRDLEKGEPW